MTTIIADTSALAAAAESGFLELLPENFERIILSPAVVDELIEIDVIDALMATAVEQIIEVVSLTQQDEELAREFARLIAMESVVADESTHMGEAEALALMSRADLEPALCLCDDAAALVVASQHNISARSFLSFVTDLKGEQAAESVWAITRAHEPSEPVEGQKGNAPELRESGDAGAACDPSFSGRVAPDEDPLSRIAGSPYAGGVRLEEPATLPVDAETMALIDALLEQEVGQDAQEIVRRAIRAFAAAFEVL